ncbi:NAD-dependent oxidoreductase [Bifidobacterium actinocoloniiforme DSM 22766]|uniref:NAD-dependent oxidoreductase n=1 Tax=Bifidobacterium actinocoloniiforme DSM 22766 TaxID=1437605 RepID=A0A086Z0Q4_9BIFI|nr:Gfo/Idh/MocA family oxidoreductase [Bifidobacterium actinocoloniiforme]AKV55311.1 oxidoreductase [Bifidobacterium actinocoloniiforme DSM 22766]KFI40104.1 NAD-dependent oxidoreductase [Bifidobacterium actinocoloniiforme DSM 22766]
MSALNGMGTQASERGLRVKVAILGAGRIAQHMADTLTRMAQDKRYQGLVEPWAVASRSEERAEAFAKEHGIPKAYGSYQGLLDDPDVDLVYIATPHSLHAEQAHACLQAGQNILVEKSFTANAAQAGPVLDEARELGLLCTEAIWTRYMPSRKIVDNIIESGAIGQVKAASANLCYPTTHKPRMTDPALAGGALLDVGVYPLNFLDMVFGPKPLDRVESTALMHPTGVDEHNATTLLYRDGTMGLAASSMTMASDRSGAIWGTEGYLVCRNINNIEGIDVYDADHQLVAHRSVPAQLTGYEYEVAAAARAILDGASECPQMPHADTLRMMELMDRIRGIWGMSFPFERPSR